MRLGFAGACLRLRRLVEASGFLFILKIACLWYDMVPLISVAGT